MPRSTVAAPTPSAFDGAVKAIEPLKLHPGLTAIKRGEGHGQISARDPSTLLGSVAIDDDTLRLNPSDPRWDYVIGCQRGASAAAWFVEVHSAETGEVSKMKKKLVWLKDTFLKRSDAAALASLPAHDHWVASGRINIPQNTPQFRTLNVELRKLGLKGPSKSLTIE